MTQTPGPDQLDALALAMPTGRLRLLPGGFWVSPDHPDVQEGAAPKHYATTQAVTGCTSCGWLRGDGSSGARLTKTGKQAALLGTSLAAQAAKCSSGPMRT